MFKVNDYVVYGLKGVFRIEDIRKDEYSKENETEYYVLHPAYSDNMTIMVPVNNPNTSMRHISTKEDVQSLIASIPEIDTVRIINYTERINYYKAALKTGKPEEWLKVAKTLYLERNSRSTDNKKLPKIDEDLLNTAEKRLHEEFAIALDIPQDKVSSYILKHIPEKVSSV